MKKPVERIGIFGGTFNPPHMGHLVIAERARESAGLAKVIFIPAFMPPHKVGRELIAPEHRLEMTNLAVEGNRFFEVSDVEIRQAGISYTVNTVRSLKSKFPDAELHLILGSDSVAEYDGWKDPDEIRSMVQILVYSRGTEAVNRFQPGVAHVRGPLIGISSTDIRGRVARGESIRYLVPSSVESYIRRHHLYLPPQSSSS